MLLTWNFIETKCTGLLRNFHQFSVKRKKNRNQCEWFWESKMKNSNFRPILEVWLPKHLNTICLCILVCLIVWIFFHYLCLVSDSNRFGNCAIWLVLWTGDWWSYDIHHTIFLQMCCLILLIFIVVLFGSFWAFFSLRPKDHMENTIKYIYNRVRELYLSFQNVLQFTIYTNNKNKRNWILHRRSST